LTTAQIIIEDEPTSKASIEIEKSAEKEAKKRPLTDGVRTGHAGEQWSRGVIITKECRILRSG